MNNLTNDTEFDAVLIGSGHNALAAAVHLGSRGWKVAVLEGQASAGGAVKTAEVTLPGFRHDLFAMNLSLLAGSPFHAEHGALLAQHGLSFVPVNKPFASVFSPNAAHPEGRWCGVEQDLQANLAHIQRISPSDVQRWQALTQQFERQMPHLFGLLGQAVPSWKNLQWLWQLWRTQGTAGSAELLRLLLSSSRHWLQAHLDSPELQAMLAAWGLHLDFAPDIAGGALFPYLEAMVAQNFGMALGQGGAGHAVDALVRCIQAQGSQVLLNATVQRIEVQGQQARAVVLADGRRLLARRAVIAGVHPQQLYGPLLGEQLRLPERAVQAARLRPGPATMMIHLALKDLPHWRASADLRGFAYVHVAPSLDQMARTYREAQSGLLPAEPVLVVGQPTAFDASRAPEGQHVLWVQVRALPFGVQGDAAGQLQAREWDDLSEAYADRVMALLEIHAPGLSKLVLARHVISPTDLVRSNPNLVGGDSLSGSHHMDQFFVFRPSFGLSRWRTPVKGLFHIGASTWPGAGTGAGSGYMLAKELAA